MSSQALEGAAPRARADLTLVATTRSSAEGSTREAERSQLEPFAVELQRRDHVAVVRPRGELDIATIETLDSAVEAAIAEALRAALDLEHAARLVLDLRGLSFIDSTGLHLLVALHQRTQRDGCQLTILAPAAPIDRAIRLCGLDEWLPFADA